MAKNKPNPVVTAIKSVVEVLGQDVGAHGGRNLVSALEDNLKRVPPDVMRSLAGASHLMAGLVQAPLTAVLTPRIGAESAGMVAESAEAFFREGARQIRELNDKSDANVQAVIDTQAVKQRYWAEVRLDLIKGMTANRKNFNDAAMTGLGDLKEQMRNARLVNEGLEMMAKSKNPSDWDLATNMDLTTTNALRQFADAVEMARNRKAAGKDPLPALVGAAFAITSNDSVMTRVLAATGMNIARGARDGVRDGVKWTGREFMDKVWPVLHGQTEYVEPTRTERGWWGRIWNPVPTWGLRGANIRMTFQWFAEALGGMLSGYAKLIGITMGIFMATSWLMVLCGHTGHPVWGMFFAGIGAFMGYIAFVINVTYAPLAIDLGRMLVGTPLLLVNELLNMFGNREDRVEFAFDGPTVSHLRDIRWRIAMATLGLPTFLLLASMIVGPNVGAFVAAFGLGGVSALVSIGAHFYADDSLNKRLIYGGTIVTFPILFVVSLWSVFNAGYSYGYDTTLQFNEFYGATVLNFGQALYLSLPVFVMTLALTAVIVKFVMGVKSKSFASLVWGGIIIVALAFAVWGVDSMIPRRDTPLVHVPKGMQQHVVPQTTAVTYTAGPANGAPAQAPTTGASQNPWDESYAEDIGEF
jgi:hypothetical protein